MPQPVTVTRDIHAPSAQLYAMVSDVTRMGDWSPESEGGEWLGDMKAAQPGARFKTTNRNGNKSWKTTSTVVAAEPGRVFSFRVSVGPLKVSEWSYSFETTPSGCRLTESWTDLRPGWSKPLGRFSTGVSDRETHNRSGMEQTLERLAAAAESDSPAG